MPYSLSQSLCLSLILLGCFLRMTFRYTNLRKDRVYSLGKDKAPDLSSFKTLSKLLFIFSMVFTATTYWQSFSWAGLWHQQFLYSALGIACVLFGVWNLSQSFVDLGENYSPLFDAFLPKEIISEGAYKKIRHPIYAYNLCVSFGLALSSGSYWVLASACLGAVFVLRSIFLEETYLADLFPEYKGYQESTHRLIPYIF